MQITNIVPIDLYRNNKYFLYASIKMFLDNRYSKIMNFCDDFTVLYRETDNKTLDKNESLIFDEVDSILQLYSPFLSDREKYPYKTDEDVLNIINKAVKLLNIE